MLRESKMPSPRAMRCAIYTRKSTDRGLDLNVTSLEAQRDVCSSYIKCQAHRNWFELPTLYNDGGYSGGNLDRPALRALMADIEDGRVDCIVIYKMDRLTRSLLDFVRLVEVLEKHKVSFVSVTQTFDTSDSMGRLILNILLTFAQFEREVMSDRVRDKKAALLRKGFYTGGLPPFGYLIDSGGRLCIDDERGTLVREIFHRYASGWQIPAIVKNLAERGWRTRRYVSRKGRRRGGQPITTAVISHVLRNPIYTGSIVHRGDWIPAEIDPLITRQTWDLVQEEITRRFPKIDHNHDFLSGLLFDELGRKMKIMREGPGRTNAFRYYRSERSSWSQTLDHKAVFVRANEAEDAVKLALGNFLRDPQAIRAAIMLEERYSVDIARLLKCGALAAGRLEKMERSHFRSALLALSPRIEVHDAELRILIHSRELRRFLAWDGIAVFSPKECSSGEDYRVWIISCAASLSRGHARYLLPIEPRSKTDLHPDAGLTRLVSEATAFREQVHAHRASSLSDIAVRLRVTRNYLVRVLRINYLAPDILISILDGSQPEGLTRKALLDAAMVLDWKCQRAMLGFEPSR